MKTVEEIYQEMLASFARRTGMQPAEGCDLSARMYALAAQVYALHVQADWVARQAFPQTADGVYLDRHAQLRGLQRKTASAAQGVVRFYSEEPWDQPRSIPAGTVCLTAGLVRFETTEDATLPSGSTWVDVPVRALLPGSIGNVPASAIRTMAVAPTGISSCSNLAPCSGGADGEDDDALRERVLDSFRRLPNGANAAFYLQSALSFDRIVAASVIPRPRGAGSVDVVVSTQSGLADQELLDQLQSYFDARREIAVDVRVRTPEAVLVDVSARVEPADGFDRDAVLNRVRNAIRHWFTGKRLGESLLRAAFGDLIYRCEGVRNYTLTFPAADLIVSPDQLPVLNNLQVVAMP